MVTLVALGLVERARLGEGPAAPLGFRLTELGRAVFGAPEVAPPPEPAERRCLVIQPNFDVVAYLDQADARTAGLLGGSPRAAPPTRAPSRHSASPRPACTRRRRAG